MLLSSFGGTNKIVRIHFWNKDTLKEEPKDTIVASAEVLVQMGSSA